MGRADVLGTRYWLLDTGYWILATSETPSWQRVVGDMKDAVIGKRASADDLQQNVSQRHERTNQQKPPM